MQNKGVWLGIFIGMLGLAVIGGILAGNGRDTTPPPPPANVVLKNASNLQLKPGDHRWCMTAKDKAGNVSKPTCVNFTVPPKQAKLAGDQKRRLDLHMDFNSVPNITADVGTDSGLPIEQQYYKVTFSVDGALKKTVTKPFYTYSSPPVGAHKLTVTAYTIGGDLARVQENYVKP